MSESGARPPKTLCVRLSKLCTLISGKDRLLPMTFCETWRSRYLDSKSLRLIMPVKNVSLTVYTRRQCSTAVPACSGTLSAMQCQPSVEQTLACLRCLTLDDDSNAWVGSEAGNVKKVQQVNLKQPAGGLSKWLEVKVVLKWRDPAFNSTGRSSKSTSIDSLSTRVQNSAVARLSEPHLPRHSA